MPDKRKICVVTGTRADYGLLQGLMSLIAEQPCLELQTLVTGMHLSPEFGLTYRTVEQDGFTIDAKVEMLLSSDSPVGIAKSLGLGVIGMADALARLEPDLSILLGDRFETLAAAQAALIARVPVAHIAGGDTTEGAFDEAIRHAITKMAHLHFVTNEQSRRRVIQLGEAPERVFNVGSPGIDAIVDLEPLSREDLERDLGYTFRKVNLLVTFHPVTLETDSHAQFQALLDAIESLGDDVGVIFTGSNADTDGRALTTMMRAFEKNHAERVKVFTSLGQRRYLSVMKYASVVVGNSSSGLYEAPSLKVPTVDIGDRQKGRLRAASVINVTPTEEAIRAGIERALNKDFSHVTNPYGEGTASRQILDVLVKLGPTEILLKKQFYDLPDTTAQEATQL